jgi:cellulose biosynthesis protein BcsQ
LDALREARRDRPLRLFDAPAERDPGRRSFQVLTVTSNKGGVGKTTFAANLAVYLRALREDLPILLLGLDEQPMIDRMFGIGSPASGADIATGLREGSFASAVRLGQYGVHYVPSSPRISELKSEITEVGHLQRALEQTSWHGVVIIDTKSDFEILTRNAIAASHLSIVVVKDQASLEEASRVFGLLELWRRGSDRARVLLSLMDLRVKYRDEGTCDILALLLAELRRRGYPHFPTFISRSPKIESLYTNPTGRALSILHGAHGSLVHRQMHQLANDVLETLDGDESREAKPALPLFDASRWAVTSPAGNAVSRR